MIKKICVVGAGTMGSGIAFVAAQHLCTVTLFDLQPETLSKAEKQVEANLKFLLNKEKININEANNIRNNIQYTSNQSDCVGDLIVEAIVEKLEVKQKLFQQLAAINTNKTIFASNTSSLSISSIQQNVSFPERVVGMHFFNPAHIMKLVELVQGNQTSEATMQALMEFCIQLKKTAVRCVDAPGFIVNRVARPYYLEAMHQVEQHGASVEQVDAALENAGFKLGAFKLMDLIGMDVNLAVSESVYAAFDQAVRFKPAALQIQKVAEGKLGKKSGEGFYLYHN